MAINTHQADHVEYIQDSNNKKHYLNAEYLDGHSYADISTAIGKKGTVTSVATADGITGGSITTSGTIKANLKSYTKNTAEIGGRLYGVELDKNGKLAVNVPWTDTHQAIKTLKTDNTTAQATNASEAIAGTGTINLHKVAKTGSYSDLNDKPTNLVTTDAEQTVTGTKHFNAITANTIGTGSDANNYFQSQKFRGEGDANTYYHAVDFGYAGHNQVDFYEYGGNYNFYINTQANTDSRQLLFGINPSGIKIPPAAGAKVLGTNAEGQVESHSLGIADISSLQSTLDGKVNSSSLATVAKTGSYNDLSNKPTIPDISGLVPYTGASKDVNLGKHSLFISNKTGNTGNPTIKLSAKGLSEDDCYCEVSPTSIFIQDPGSSITYGNNYIDSNGIKIYLPGASYTTSGSEAFALKSNLSTLLDKGTSSTVVNQVVYNPVEMKKALTVPSIQGTKYTDNSGSQQSLFTLGGTASESGGVSTGSSSLTLYRNRAGNWDSATIAFTPADGLKINNYAVGVQDWANIPASYILTNGDGVTKDYNGGVKLKSNGGTSDDFVIDSFKNGKLHSKITFGSTGPVGGGWCIDGSKILTESSISTQQWKLTSTSGTVTTVNICVK